MAFLKHSPTNSKGGHGLDRSSPKGAFVRPKDQTLPRPRAIIETSVKMKTIQRGKARIASGTKAVDLHKRSPGNAAPGSALAGLAKGLTLGFIAEDTVLNKAIEVIGDGSKAMRWMGTPVRALGYATPVSLLGTEDGMNSVLTVLSRLERVVLLGDFADLRSQ